ncbi:MAG: BRCT domain-containing protein [Mesorhizobium sp.]
MVQKRGRTLEHEGAALGRIHASANYRKALGYWLGFLRGVLASEQVERAEMAPLRVEAEQFLALLHDDDAVELIRDLDMWRDSPEEVYSVLQTIVGMRSREFLVSSDKDEVNEFYGFCAGIACDNSITPAEVEKLLARLDSSVILQDDKRVASLGYAARRAISDGRITSDEAEDICGWITRLVGDSATDTGLPTFGNVGVLDGALEDASQFRISGQMFVLTGKFVIGPRKVIAGMINDLGGEWKNTVCGKTNYLVVAAEASRDWKHSHEGIKIIKAMELREKGGRPDLVHEPMLAQALGL